MQIIMEATTTKPEIKRTYQFVRKHAFSEKQSPMLDEDKINVFLDAILMFKKQIAEKTTVIHTLNTKLEKLTWLENLDNDSLMLVNDIISHTKDLHSSLIRQYVTMTPLRKKGIAKNEIKEFKSSIDDLKESYEDLESVFFYLPELPGFKETTKALSLI